MNEQRLARFLGLFSFGLGLAEVIAPDRLTRFLGTQDGVTVVRGYGLREIASGVGIFAQSQPKIGVWSRVAGDMLDLASLGVAMRSSSHRRNIAIAIGMVAGVTLLDVLCGRKLSHDVTKAPGRYPPTETAIGEGAGVRGA